FHVTGVQTCALPISQFRRDLRLPTSVVQRRTVGEADHGDELQPRINLVDDLPLSLRICPAEVDRPSGDEQRCTVVGTGDILGLVQPDSPLDLSGAGVFLSVEALWALSTDYRNTWLMVRVVRVRSRDGDVGVSVDQRPEVH